MPTESANPVGYIVRHRPHLKHARWRTVAAVRTHDEGVALATGPGDWWIAAVCDEALYAEAASGTSAA